MRKTSQGRKISTDVKPELVSLEQMVKHEGVDVKAILKEENQQDAVTDLENLQQ